jgi:hypothetical protein
MMTFASGTEAESEFDATEPFTMDDVDLDRRCFDGPPVSTSRMRQN